MIDTLPPLIESIPPSDAASGGRALSMSPAAVRARADRAARKAAGGAPAKARGKARTPRASGRRGAPKTLYPEIAATLSLVNLVFTMSPLGSLYADPASQLPDGTFERTSHAGSAYADAVLIRLGDELDPGEIELLSKGLDAQAQRSPRFRRQIERILGVSSGGQIVTALSLILTRRASRHGLAPAMLDPMIGAIIDGGDLGALASFTPTPERSDVPETGEIAPRETDTSDIDTPDEFGRASYEDL